MFNGSMRALVQRVSEASVLVNGSVTGQIGSGLLVLLGIRSDDTHSRAELLARKVVQLRVFPDDEGKMNRSLLDTSGELLVVPQFTLYGDTGKGNRPSYSQAAMPKVAEPLYEYFVQLCRDKCIPVSTGVFQAHMKVRLVNDGPVTLMCYSEE
jgi:D-aminoacyl-tRNA deacylase